VLLFSQWIKLPTSQLDRPHVESRTNEAPAPFPTFPPAGSASGTRQTGPPERFILVAACIGFVAALYRWMKWLDKVHFFFQVVLAVAYFFAALFGPMSIVVIATHLTIGDVDGGVGLGLSMALFVAVMVLSKRRADKCLCG
jgi:hypothetical protein